MDADRREPVIADEVTGRIAVRYVPSGIWIEIEFREAKIDHIECLLSGCWSKDTVAQLDITVQYASCVHEAQPIYLWSGGHQRMSTSVCMKSGGKESSKRSTQHLISERMGIARRGGKALTICTAIEHTLRRSHTSCLYVSSRCIESRLRPSKSMAR